MKIEAGYYIWLLRNDGSETSGIVSRVGEGQYDVTTSEDGEVCIAEADLDDARGLYVGMPTESVSREVPVGVKPNGQVTQYNGTFGFVEVGGSQRLLRSATIMDDGLKQLPAAGLTGKGVLCVIADYRETHRVAPVPAGYIMQAGTLDETLDRIAILAEHGRRDLATLFCNELRGQFPEDEDIRNFLDLLNREVDRGIDFHSPIQDGNPAKLKALGRIYSIEGNSGYIIDVDSQEKLFFFDAQLFGDLAKMSDEELIGRPVLYSVKKNGNNSFQARTIFEPMTKRDAFWLAEDMRDYAPLNACDLLRIIIRQTGDEGIREDLRLWTTETVRTGLWPEQSLPTFNGVRVPMWQFAGDLDTFQVHLERHGVHTETIVEVEPCIPHILFGDLPVAVPEAPEPAPAPAVAENDVKAEADADMEPRTEVPSAEVAPAVTTEPEEGRGQASHDEEDLDTVITEEEIGTSEQADEMVPANATITYRFGVGTLTRETDEGTKEQEFRLEDIIDDQLREETESRNMSTGGYVGNRPVVCDFSLEGEARHICAPDTVGNMLREALRLFGEAGDSRHRGTSLYLYEKAMGYVANVRNVAGGNLCARRLYYAVEENIRKLREANVESRGGNAGNDLPLDANLRAVDKLIREKLLEEAIRKCREHYEAYDERAISQRQNCVLLALRAYSMYIKLNPGDVAMLTEYKEYGESHIENRDGNKDTEKRDGNKDTVIGLPARKAVRRNAQYIINYYSDMILHHEVLGIDHDVYSDRLIETYGTLNERLGSLLRDGVLTNDEYEVETSINEARIAWRYLLKTGRLTEDEKEAARRHAKNAARNDIDLGLVCLAVIGLRYNRSESEFAAKRIASLDLWSEWAGPCGQAGGLDAQDTLERERFAILCALRSSAPGRLGDVGEEELRLVARYAATLYYTKNEEYNEELADGGHVTADCWCANVLMKCMSKGAAWTGWKDLRVLAMLSGKCAAVICHFMFCLDAETACDILARGGISFGHDHSRVKENLFIRKFLEWSTGLHTNFIQLLDRVDNIEENEYSLKDCAGYMKNDLRYAAEWMPSCDERLLTELRQDLGRKVEEFCQENNPRLQTVKSREIREFCDYWSAYIGRHPSVILLTACHRLLNGVRESTAGAFNALQFGSPQPVLRIVNASAVIDGNVLVEMELRNNEPNAYPMLNCALSLQNPECEVEVIDKPRTYNNASELYGGEYAIYIVRLRLAESLRGRERVSLCVNLTYNTDRDGLREAGFALNLRIFTKDDFKPVVMDYNFGGLEADERYFYGRNELLDRMMAVFENRHNFPHFFLYGQKRSGKSSVLEHFRRRMEEKGKVICVPVDISGITLNKGEGYLYYQLTQKVESVVKMLNRSLKKADRPMIQLPEKLEGKSLTVGALEAWFGEMKANIHETEGFGEHELLLLLDEFTSIYGMVKNKVFDEGFMGRWKSIQTARLFKAVLIGQDVLHSFVEESGDVNAFSALSREHLNYLDANSARLIVTERMKDCNNGMLVYTDRAIDKILEYSASSAYYTKAICDRAVRFYNETKLQCLTEADIEEVVRLVLQDQDPKKLFNSLLEAGRGATESRFSADENKFILDQIARKEQNDPVRGCYAMELVKPENKPDSYIDDIVADLEERKVIEVLEDRKYCKIIVKLYTLWATMKK